MGQMFLKVHKWTPWPLKSTFWHQNHWNPPLECGNRILAKSRKRPYFNCYFEHEMFIWLISKVHNWTPWPWKCIIWYQDHEIPLLQTGNQQLSEKCTTAMFDPPFWAGNLDSIDFKSKKMNSLTLKMYYLIPRSWKSAH